MKLKDCTLDSKIYHKAIDGMKLDLCQKQAMEKNPDTEKTHLTPFHISDVRRLGRP